ncbi:MAG: hypothetical protein HZB55_03845 [Deltaproteobacteria bacterium]|nr:hypothetical protein [Deltaproteobacteria bacterium]
MNTKAVGIDHALARLAAKIPVGQEHPAPVDDLLLENAEDGEGLLATLGRGAVGEEGLEAAEVVSNARGQGSIELSQRRAEFGFAKNGEDSAA